MNREAGDWDNFARFASLEALTRVPPPSLLGSIAPRDSAERGAVTDG